MIMKPLKALIVDDVKLIRTELKIILEENKQIKVIGEAANVKDALIIIQDNKPDVLLLDIHLPGQSGFDLLDSLEEEIKTIFISSYFYKYSDQALKYNPVAFLSKPISKLKLYDAVNKLTEQIYNI